MSGLGEFWMNYIYTLWKARVLVFFLLGLLWDIQARSNSSIHLWGVIPSLLNCHSRSKSSLLNCCEDSCWRAVLKLPCCVSCPIFWIKNAKYVLFKFIETEIIWFCCKQLIENGHCRHPLVLSLLAYEIIFHCCRERRF